MTTTFLIVAVVASAFLGLQLLILMFGGDMEFDSDMDADAGDGGGFMSVRSLTAFFGGFGWAGLAAKQSDWSDAAAIGVGIAAGLAFFFIIGFMFIQARKLTQNATLNYDTAVGQDATVYLAIPPNQGQGGKVEVTISGRLTIVEARSNADEPIPSGTRVRVTESVSGNTVMVERL